MKTRIALKSQKNDDETLINRLHESIFLPRGVVEATDVVVEPIEDSFSKLIENSHEVLYLEKFVSKTFSLAG